MTDILCRWLNEDVKLSRIIDPINIAKEFSTGFLLGELLNKHGLQEDFSFFSQNITSDSKLHNFTRLEPTLKLLEVPFDTNVAQAIMSENHSTITRLMYQLFIALGKKSKMGLTGVAMETMRPSGPMKLESIESGLYKEKITLKQDSVAIARDLLHSAVKSFVHEVAIEAIRDQISNLAVDLVKDLQEISFEVVHDMRTVVAQVRELGQDRTLKKFARNIMKDVLSTSRVVMQFINDLDDIIQVLKNVFETTIS